MKLLTMGGMGYVVPKWFTIIQVHLFISYVKAATPLLYKYRDEKALYSRLCNFCYSNYLEIIPMDVIDTLSEIQHA